MLSQNLAKKIFRPVNRGLEIFLLGNSKEKMTTQVHSLHCTSLDQGRRALETRHHEHTEEHAAFFKAEQHLPPSEYQRLRKP